MQDLGFIPIAKPVCPECRGTGKITLSRSIVDCTACKPEHESYVVYDFVVDSDAKKTNVSSVRHIQMVGRGIRNPVQSERAFYRSIFGDGCGF
jgi:hypothetical protein